MKLRSKSPFAKRRQVRDLLDDVRKASDAIHNISANSENSENNTVGMLDTSTEESNSILSTPRAQRNPYADDRRRDWNQSLYEEVYKDLEGRDSEGGQRRNLSESEVAKQKKTAELVQKTRQMVQSRKEKKEAKDVDHSNTTTPTSQNRSTTSKQQKSLRFSRRKSMGQQQQQQQVVEVKKVVKGSPWKSRSKSPFRRWRRAEDLVKDIRQKELNVPHTPSTASSSIPLRSATGTPPAAATNTPSRKQRPEQSSESRSKSPFRRIFNKSGDSTPASSIPSRSAADSPLAADNTTPGTPCTPGTPSMTQSPEQNRTSRSRSPFRRFFKKGELIKQIKLVEHDFAFELQRKPSQQTATRGRSPASPTHRRKKARELIPDNRKDGPKEVEVVLTPSRSCLASLSSKASKSSPPASPAPKESKSTPPASPAKGIVAARIASSEEQLRERGSFRNRFTRTVTPSATMQSKAKQHAAASTAVAVVSGYETPQHRPSLFGKKSESRAAPATEEKKSKSKSPKHATRSIPRLITKCNRSTVSDLSSPVFSGGQCRSISGDSARKVRKALQRSLGSDTRSVKSVKTVMETLSEVTDKLESEDDKKTLRKALSRLETAADSDASSRSSADSESIPSDSRPGGDEDESEFGFEDDFDSDDDTGAFTRWETMGRVTVQSILAMIGLPYLWSSPETVEEEDEDSTSTSSTSASEKSTDETDDAQIALESPIASKAKLVDDEETSNLIMDDDEMLRELEELDHKLKLEKERAARKKIEARAALQKNIDSKLAEERRTEEEMSNGSKKRKDATLKARLERRRKKEIMVSEQKTREAEALKQLKAAEDARLRKEAEAEKQRKITAQVQAEKFAREQEQAARESVEKKRIRLEEIKEASRRREAEERRKKIQLQKAAEATKRRKQAEEADQKRRRDRVAKVLLANAKAAKMRRAEFEQRRLATWSQRSAGTSSGYSTESTDTDSCPFPKPLSQKLLRSAKASSFRPVREDEISSIGYSDTDFDSRLTSSVWSDDDNFSLESVESSQFDVPPMKKGKKSKAGCGR